MRTKEREWHIEATSFSAPMRFIAFMSFLMRVTKLLETGELKKTKALKQKKKHQIKKNLIISDKGSSIGKIGIVYILLVKW